MRCGFKPGRHVLVRKRHRNINMTDRKSKMFHNPKEFSEYLFWTWSESWPLFWYSVTSVSPTDPESRSGSLEKTNSELLQHCSEYHHLLCSEDSLQGLTMREDSSSSRSVTLTWWVCEVEVREWWEINEIVPMTVQHDERLTSQSTLLSHSGDHRQASQQPQEIGINSGDPFFGL